MKNSSVIISLFIVAMAYIPTAVPFAPPIAPRSRTARSPALLGWFSDDDKDSTGVKPPTLTAEQDSALRDFASVAVDLHGYSWFRRSECLDDARAKHPPLAELTDDELAAAYLSQKPSFVDVIVKTPVGAFLAINLILWAAGFSWCDTPFGNPDACPPGGL